jgi:VWFA-related protein
MKFAAENLILVVLLITGFCLVVRAQRTSDFVSPERLSLTVTVSNASGFLRNFTTEDFEIYLENKRGVITSVKQEDEPVSVGILVDVSSSMRTDQSGKTDKMAFGVKAFPRFLANANRENDYFVMSFAKGLNLVLDSTQDGEKVKKTLEELAANKLRETDTKFYDALNAAFEKFEGAKHQKKVLILISDGQDNSNTKLDLKDIGKLVRQNDVLLYSFRIIPEEVFQDSRDITLSLRRTSILERDYGRLQFEIASFPTGYINDFLYSIKVLEDMAAASGGRGFYPLNQAETYKAFEILAEELKSQYLLTVNPSSALKKDRANEIRVKAPKLKDTKKVSVRARKSFYF